MLPEMPPEDIQEDEEALPVGSDEGSRANGILSSAAAQPAVDDGIDRSTPLELERRFLASLTKLITNRATSEKEIVAREQANLTMAAEAHVKAQANFQSWLASEEVNIGQQAEEQTQKAHARFETQVAQLDAEMERLRDKVHVEFDAARQAAQEEEEEAGLQAEAVFDSQKKIAPRQLQEFEQQLEAWQTRVRTDRDEAKKLLESWRQPIVEPPRTETEARAAVKPAELSKRLQECVDVVGTQLAELQGLHAPKMARSPIMIVMYLVATAATPAVLWWIDQGPIIAGAGAGIVLIGSILMAIMLRRVARSSVLEHYPELVRAAAEAESLMHRALSEARARTAAQQTKITEQRDHALESAELLHHQRLADIEAQIEARLQRPHDAYHKRLTDITNRRDTELVRIETARKQRQAEYARRKVSDARDIEERNRKLGEKIVSDRQARSQALVDWWRAGLARGQGLLDRIQLGCPPVAKGEVPASNDPPGTATWLSDWQVVGENWPPAAMIPPGIRFGKFEVEMSQLPEGISGDRRLAEHTPDKFVLPAFLPFPERASLVFKARGKGRAAAVDALQAVMVRLLVAIPPSKIRYTIIDPVGLGENFAAFMHLADFNEAIVTSRIWTDSKHIEQRLTDLSEHMENVIQKYLRNEYQNIEQYNRQAGEIAEPYRFLVIANFPEGFSDAAQRRVLSIASSGPRCGVYLLMTVDMQLPLTAGVMLRDIEAHATTLNWTNAGNFEWKDEQFSKFPLTLDSPPPPAQMTSLIQAAGRYASQAGKVEVPFDVVAPKPADEWASSAARGIDVPLGRAGATRLQSMKLGKGTSQHVLVAGKTGSGKSTLLHILITNLALRYSPDEVELYLIDFKQGVEFKTYATYQLPHARVVAIESDREFGVSVLARLDVELKARADLFRDAGAQNLGDFRKNRPDVPQPRILLIIDEFQEFFTEDDKPAQEASLLLDRLVRQGRAFGIHVMLGSQTLAGAYSLARSTLGQMAVRIALQCSEADSSLILSEENSAARLLTRAGEAIYNDTNGLLEGNHPFQIVWLTEERRDQALQRVHELTVARKQEVRPQLVFEGNVPADLAENEPLNELLRAGRPATAPQASRAWLGDPVAIKEITSLMFRPQSGCNILMVGQNEEAMLGIMASTVLSLSAQYPLGEAGCRFYIIDGSAIESSTAASFTALADVSAHPIRLVTRRDIGDAINEIAQETAARRASGSGDFPPIFVLVVALHKLRELWKQEDDFGFSRSGEDKAPNPGKQFTAILSDGPTMGVHTLTWCDSINNLNRATDRQSLREFELRIAFQMSVNDSSTFIDSPAAGKLGQNRAILHSEEQGLFEKFRPYRWPSPEWLAFARERLGGGTRQPDDPQPRRAALERPAVEPASEPSSEESFGRTFGRTFDRTFDATLDPPTTRTDDPFGDLPGFSSLE